ncbi:hypothetical protein ACFLXB_09755 [Chloroflexota bacterium]
MEEHMKEPDYKHTQYGVLMFVVFIIVGILITVVAIAIIAEGRVLAAVIMICLTIAFMAMFFSSTVEVSAGKVRFWFGIGVVRKTIALTEIQSTRTVINPWYYFWGIKSISGGWLYAIAPGPALEITLKDGKVIHFGSNQPAELKKAIEKAKQAVE